MKKRLLFVALMLVSGWNMARAQQADLFIAPDTVCFRQPIKLISKVNDASSYYWGFCSGFLFYAPTGFNQGNPSGLLNAPSAIEIAKYDTSYIGFVANSGSNELLRYDFGASLSNTPTITNFGNLNNTLPDATSKLYITQDDGGNWFMFACGGTTGPTSSIARFDFGQSLLNTPNSVNFGNLGNQFNIPRGIFVAKERNEWFGYVANQGDNSLLRLDFGNNISLTPSVLNLGATFGLDAPRDMTPVKDTSGDWYIFAVNYDNTDPQPLTNSTLTRIDLIDSLDNDVPVGTVIGNVNGRLFGPSSITYARDCDYMHLFITNQISNDFLRIDLPSLNGPYTASSSFTGVGALSLPASMSRIIREKDNIYSYIVNAGNSTLSQITFAQCADASIASSDSLYPPQYAYYPPVNNASLASQTYNVYFVVNEGKPDMRTQCKQIYAHKAPQITFENDTLICQGDTIELFVQAYGSLDQQWYPNVDISDIDSFTVYVHPDFTTTYHVVLPYADGCVVDTPVTVSVNKIKADAGPDRIIHDGAKTQIGGPNTTEGNYTYTWTPDQFISNTIITNPVVNPPFDYTYYLEVRDNNGCTDIDTVVVSVSCNGINLPNAFVPESRNPVTNRFGLLNKQFVKLNFFRIYDRWGKEVFSTTDLTKQWDGTVDGEPAPYGVYIWEADGFCGDGPRFRETGNVTLIR